MSWRGERKCFEEMNRPTCGMDAGVSWLCSMQGPRGYQTQPGHEVCPTRLKSKEQRLRERGPSRGTQEASQPTCRRDMDRTRSQGASNPPFGPAPAGPKTLLFHPQIVGTGPSLSGPLRHGLIVVFSPLAQLLQAKSSRNPRIDTHFSE